MLYRTESLGVDSASEPSYPEGNFEGNQLLGGSIGLSPLCRTQATQFARQNSFWPPLQFPTASPWHGIVHHLSGPMDHAFTQNPVHWTLGLVSHAESTLRLACFEAGSSTEVPHARSHLGHTHPCPVHHLGLLPSPHPVVFLITPSDMPAP